MVDLLRSSTTHAQFVRYFVVAAVGLAVDFSTVIFAKEILDFHYLLAATSGFLLGLIVTYFLSNVFVFGTPKSDPWTAFFLFGLIGVVGLGILILLMRLLTGAFEVNYIVAKAVATIVVFMWNFLARKSLYHDE